MDREEDTIRADQEDRARVRMTSDLGLHQSTATGAARSVPWSSSRPSSMAT